MNINSKAVNPLERKSKKGLIEKRGEVTMKVFIKLFIYEFYLEKQKKRAEEKGDERAKQNKKITCCVQQQSPFSKLK